MRRLIAAASIVLTLASCTGRAGIASGAVLMTAGGIGLLTGPHTDTNGGDSNGGGSCEGAHGYCGPDLDLDFDAPTPGLGTFLLGTALVIFGFATIEQEDEKIAAERAAAGVDDLPPAPPAPPAPPTKVTRETGVWREVPPVPGDDAP